MTEQEFRIVREVSFEVAPDGDGRTIEARIIPFDTEAMVADPPDYVPYPEKWSVATFDKQEKAANRVLLNVEHEDGIRGVVGHGIALEARPDALYGTFRVHPNSDGDKTLHLVNEGILTGLSVEAIVTRSRRTADGVVERLKARLDKVSLCRFPAFLGAEVLAVREQPMPSPEPGQPVPPSEPAPDDDETRRSEVDELLKRVGYEPLVARKVSNKPWSGAASKYEDTAAYCQACLIDKNPDGAEKVQENCMLPVYEPDGALNRNALGAAAARLNQVSASGELKAAAARKLVRLYGQVPDLDPPPALRQMAGR